MSTRALSGGAPVGRIEPANASSTPVNVGLFALGAPAVEGCDTIQAPTASATTSAWAVREARAPTSTVAVSEAIPVPVVSVTVSVAAVSEAVPVPVVSLTVPVSAVSVAIPIPAAAARAAAAAALLVCSAVR